MTALIVNSVADIKQVVDEQAEWMDFGSGDRAEAIASVVREIQGLEHPDYGQDWREFLEGVDVERLLSKHQQF